MKFNDYWIFRTELVAHINHNQEAFLCVRLFKYQYIIIRPCSHLALAQCRMLECHLLSLLFRITTYDCSQNADG